MSLQQENSLAELKSQLFKYIKVQLADGIIDVELDAEHLESAYQATINTYRQRAQSSTEESYSFMTLVQNVNTYVLPEEVASVRQIFRRTFGDSVGPFASNFDPFSQASMNVYLMNFNVSGGMATFDYYTQYVQLAGRMFGAFLNYTFNPVSKKLQLIRDPKGTGEEVLLWTYNWKPEFVLLSDPMTRQWIRNFMYANCKMIIGEAREKFSSISGPQGPTTLNGAAMKAEAKEIMEQCILDLRNYVDGSQPISFVVG